MGDFSFRDLRADEIDVRVAEIARSGAGLTLLLYKTARADMAILDETLTPMGWRKSYHEGKGTLFCSVGIRDPETGEWVDKEDAGAPSSFEAVKGEASDAFKRACTNWGIGRELYTAPRIWVPREKASIRQNGNGKPACYDRFSVAKVVIVAHRIMALAVRNDTLGRVAFVWEDPAHAARRKEAEAAERGQAPQPAPHVHVVGRPDAAAAVQEAFPGSRIEEVASF